MYTTNFAIIKKLFTLDGKATSVFDLETTFEDKIYFGIDPSMNQIGNLFLRETKFL